MEYNEYDYIVSKPELNDDLLMHYGVKGMRWGHRKQRPLSTGRFYRGVGNSVKKSLQRSGRFYKKVGSSTAKRTGSFYRTAGNSVKKSLQRSGRFYKKMGQHLYNTTLPGQIKYWTDDARKEKIKKAAKAAGKGIKKVSDTSNKFHKKVNQHLYNTTLPGQIKYWTDDARKEKIKKAAKAAGKGAKSVGKHLYNTTLPGQIQYWSGKAKNVGSVNKNKRDRLERAADAAAKDAAFLRAHGFTKEADAVQKVSDQERAKSKTAAKRKKHNR